MTARPHFTELLDAPDAPPREVERSLGDLRRMNRWLGGRSVLLGIVEREARRDGLTRFSLLDVGAGSGDQGAAVASRFPDARIVLCDRNCNHLPDARSGMLRLAAEAGRLPFSDGAFDFVCASLVLHHFRDPDVVILLRLFGRVARRAVLINDLERHWFPLAFIHVARPIFARSVLTRHDAPASVRQAFRPQELKNLALQAGFQNVEVRRHLPWFRLSLVARNHA
ncbi:MAG TPA: methyltransferase domain-containing protein [Bryobacterales bacterium]|jgi:ubiquinone/menaquinone biosynthesis C-methylase UbiE|nr:methyltransferase domain-containing protein [Bryobacterales bacterium]